VTKSPRIQTNEGGAEKTVRIISHVVPRPDSTYPLVIKPYKIDISQYGEKTRDEITFMIENVSMTDLNVNLIASRPELWDLVLPETIKAQSTGEATLKLRPDAEKEQFEKSFTIEVNDEQTSRFTVPVRRFIREQTGGTTAGGTGK
jgi:hypothetical protein